MVLRIEDAGAEVADGVAADQEHAFPGTLSECLVHAEDDLGIGFAAIMKTPALKRVLSMYFKTPLPKRTTRQTITSQVPEDRPPATFRAGHHAPAIDVAYLE